MPGISRSGWLAQLRERGVLRVAASYAVIGWLLLQIADVTFEPLGAARWAMPALIVTVGLGFPVAVLLAWFFELSDRGITRDVARDDAPRPHVHGARRYADVAIIGVLLIVVAVLLVKQSDLGKPPLPAKPSLAVLPFANLSGDPGQQYFSDGLAEEVLDRLGQVPGLMVVARASSFTFRDRTLDVRSIAERLGVTTVLEGAVRRDGKRLKLNAKLIDGKSGYQLWSGSFDREVNDVFAVQAELAQAVIDAIVPVARRDAPVDASTAPPPTTSLSAYDLYLLGRAKMNTRWSENMVQAVEYFEQALERDPKFAKAQAALAQALVLQAADEDYTKYTTAQKTERAEGAVYKALALDPKLSDAQVAYANFLRDAKRDGVEDAYRHAIAANPNNSDAWLGYSVWLADQKGRETDAHDAVVRSHALDPFAITPWLNYIGLILRPGGKEFRRELDRAAVVFAGTPDSLRRFALVAGPAGYPLECWRFVTAARRDEASSGLPRSMTAVGPLGIWIMVDPRYVVSHGEPLLDDPVARENEEWLLYRLITAHGRLGNEARQRELFVRLAAMRHGDDASLNVLRAFWFSVFGHFDEAAKALQRAGPVPDETDGNTMHVGVSNDAQALPATLRTLRATGRKQQADALAGRYLARYRADRPRNPDEQRYDFWVRDAALAANEGHTDEAVELLRQAMRWADVPIGFLPELPWFRSLEGYAPYDAIVRERAARIARIEPEMLKLDASLQH